MTRQVQAAEDDLSSMAGNMSNWMDRVMGSTFRQFPTADAWSPSINICEHEKHYHVIVEIAGINPDSVSIEVNEDTVCISGDRDMPRAMEKCDRMKVHLMEIDYGHFFRSLKIPPDVDVNAVPEARYRRGLLYIRLPKKSTD